MLGKLCGKLGCIDCFGKKRPVDDNGDHPPHRVSLIENTPTTNQIAASRKTELTESSAPHRVSSKQSTTDGDNHSTECKTAPQQPEIHTEKSEDERLFEPTPEHNTQEKAKRDPPLAADLKKKDSRDVLHVEEQEQQDESDDDVQCEWGALWTAAYEKLRQDEPRLLEEYEKGILDLGNEYRRNKSTDTEINRQEEIQHVANRKLEEIKKKQLTVTFKDKTVYVRDGMRRVVQSIVTGKDVISAAITNEPHAAIVWAGVLLVLPMFLRPITQTDDATQGLEFISDLLVRYTWIEESHVKSASGEDDTSWLKKKTFSIYCEVLKYQIRFAKQFSRSTASRYLRDLLVVDDWKVTIENIKAVDKLVIDHLNVQSSTVIQEINGKIRQFREETEDSLAEIGQEVKKIHQFQLFDKLNVHEQAIYTPRTQEDAERSEGIECLKGTQISMLSQIQAWIDNDDPSEPAIFWMHGMAGTGKSTIARTIVSRLNERKQLVDEEQLLSNICLGANFFFQRKKEGRDYADTFCPTIARQLVDALPDLAEPVCKAIQQNHKVAGDGLGTQWKHLILGPLKELGQRVLPRLSILLVIDALDECLPEKPDTPYKPGYDTDNTDIQIILELLAQVEQLKELQVQVRVFLTSRPTDEIGFQFAQMTSDHYLDKTLLKIIPIQHADPSQQDDLARYFQQRLNGIYETRLKRSGKSAEHFNWDASWSNEQTIRKLVYQSNGLFIFAATACRFLAQPHTNLGDRLKMILGSGSDEIDESTPQGKIDALYIDILNVEVLRKDDMTKKEQKKRTSQFQKIVGSIITLSESLGIHALSELISNEPTMESVVEEMLQRLQSMMKISEDDNSVELLHLSFRDFLVTKHRSKEFWVDEEELHRELFERCVQVMFQTLEKDVCRLGRVSTRIKDVQPGQVEQSLPEHARYSCTSWAYHLQRSNFILSDNDMLHTFLKKHFTHWVEAMAVMEKMPAAVLMLNDLLAHMSPLSNQCSELSMFLRDGKRFLTNFKPVIEEAPLQIYTSALLFAPRNSLVRTFFADEIPHWIIGHPKVLEDWNPLLQVLEFPTTALMFSADQRYLAGTSRAGQICLWNTENWECVQQLRVAFKDVYSMSFSPDSKLLASASNDGTVEVWNLEGGTLKRLSPDSLSRECYNDVKVLFSPDSKQLISVYDPGKARIWDPYTGKLLYEIQLGSQEEIQTVTISLRGNLYLLGMGESHPYSGGSNLQLWDPAKEILFRPFEKGHARQSPSFSPDGKPRIVSWDGTLQIWDPDTETLHSGINVGPTAIASFSPCGKLLLTVSEQGHRIQVWNLETAIPCVNLDGGDLNSWTLKDACTTWLGPSCSHVMVISWYDIWVWEVSTGRLHNRFPGATNPSGVAISPDGSLLAIDQGVTVEILECLSGSSKNMNGVDHETGDFKALSPDGTLMITGKKGNMMVWNVEAKDIVQAVSLQHDSDILKAVFSQDGMRVVTITDSCSVTVWNVDSWDPLQTFSVPVPGGYTRRAWGTELLPDAGLVASLLKGETCCIDLWDIKAGEHFQTINCKEEPFKVAISPDRTLVASTFYYLSVCHVWNINTGELVKVIKNCWISAFSPTSEILAIKFKQFMQLWCTNTWNKLGELELRHTIWRVTFSGDGQWLCTNIGQIQVSSILDPGSGPTRKEITLNEADGTISEGGKELILFPPGSKPTKLFCADPSAAWFNTVALVYENGLATIIAFDHSDNRTVREVSEI